MNIWLDAIPCKSFLIPEVDVHTMMQQRVSGLIFSSNHNDITQQDAALFSESLYEKGFSSTLLLSVE